jgi:hypothetical protein
MGNRAFITNKDMEIGVYLHWNGGRDSVEAFLKYCELRGFRSGDYGIARFCQVVGNFFGGGLSIGIEPFRYWTMGDDNGLYVVDDWKIVGRYQAAYRNNETGEVISQGEWYGLDRDDYLDESGNDRYSAVLAPFTGPEQMEYDLMEMLRSIDDAQPEGERLGKVLDCQEVPTRTLKVGDIIYKPDYAGHYEPRMVVGFWPETDCYKEYFGLPITDEYDRTNVNAVVSSETAFLYSGEEDC